MKQEFETLIAHDWDADYINYLTVANFNNQALKAHAIALATAQTQAQKKVIWNIIKAIPGFGLAIGQDAVGNPIPQPDVVHLANPYYVGFGEPDADILFVGKEKGFDLISVPLQNGRNSIDKLFHESILDYFHWAKMVAFAQTGGVINDAYINNFATRRYCQAHEYGFEYALICRSTRRNLHHLRIPTQNIFDNCY